MDPGEMVMLLSSRDTVVMVSHVSEDVVIRPTKSRDVIIMSIFLFSYMSDLSGR